MKKYAIITMDVEDWYHTYFPEANVDRSISLLDGLDVALDIMKNEKRGSLNTLTVRGNKAEILAIFATVNTVFFEALPLSLEEIFISETEVVGYDIKKLILG